MKNILWVSLGLLALATSGAFAQPYDRDWWACPALPEDLVGISPVSEDWDGNRFYHVPGELDENGHWVWTRCVPIKPPAPAWRFDDEPSGRVETPLAWRGWAHDARYCMGYRGHTETLSYSEPVTFVLDASDDWNVCSVGGSYADSTYYEPRLKCWSDPEEYSWLHPRMIGQTRAEIEMSDSEATARYLQFPNGTMFVGICVTPVESAEPDTPWALYRLPGMTPMMNGGNAD